MSSSSPHHPQPSISTLTVVVGLILLGHWLRGTWSSTTHTSLNLGPPLEIITADGQVDIVRRSTTCLPNSPFDAACYWSLLALTVAMVIALVVERPFRFTLRKIFFATTLIAIVLGIILS